MLHDLQLAAGIADDVVLLNAGRLGEAVLTSARLAETFGVTLISPDLSPHPWHLTAEQRE